jgi:hypothetical protein
MHFIFFLACNVSCDCIIIKTMICEKRFLTVIFLPRFGEFKRAKIEYTSVSQVIAEYQLFLLLYKISIHTFPVVGQILG